MRGRSFAHAGDARVMGEVLNLALPYFGLILVGFVCGKLRRLPEAGLAWMNFFLLYVSLPALFFRTMARTPFEELNNIPFVVATTLATATTFTVTAIASRWLSRANLGEAAIAGIAGGYGNIGYMGPGLAFATIGAKAAAPVALIFCFDNIFLFSITPLLITMADRRHGGLGGAASLVVKQIVFHPLIVASFTGALAAAVHLELPTVADQTLLYLANAAAPVALFVLGVTVALREVRRVTLGVPFAVMMKLFIHPMIVWGALWLAGPFDPLWSATALMMAALPPALNVFIIARQYDKWVEEASTAVLAGTFVSVVSLTGMLWMIKTGHIALP